MEYIRDYVMYASVFGVFGFSWFGWAQENPPKKWRIPLGIGSGISFIIGLIGIYLSIQNWDESSALSRDGAYSSYLTFVIIEVILAAIGGILLTRYKKQSFIAPWICFVVGVHFIWLKAVFLDASLYLLAILMIGISLLSIYFSKRTSISNSALTGAGAGFVLLCFAISGLIRYFLVQT
ncbi:hypothetical protein [Shimazuella kribbensis]|uniref:hypothetical protein n=1 Tax=Shimazuella kribbensis TaxID=139808 RepID=UPI000490593F|nr:hypothetical protein [Shimazuella kribbensis]